MVALSLYIRFTPLHKNFNKTIAKSTAFWLYIIANSLKPKELIAAIRKSFNERCFFSAMPVNNVSNDGRVYGTFLVNWMAPCPLSTLNQVLARRVIQRIRTIIR